MTETDQRLASATSREPAIAAGSTAVAHDVGLLVLRIAVGLTVAAHGSQKLFGWWNGGGISGTRQFFEQMGYEPGTLFAVISGLCEFGGGLALTLGLFTPLAGAAVLGNMLNAVISTRSSGFFGGYEEALLLAVCAGGLALCGAGRFSVDSQLPVLRHHRLGYGVAAVILALTVGFLTLLVKK